MNLHPYAEELANAITHGLGSIIFMVLCPLLIAFSVQTKNTGKIIGACFFSFGLLIVYISSTMFHAVSQDFAKEVLHYFDLLSIYFLISGTYTAVILIYFKNKMGYSLLSLIWGVSFLGILLAVFWPDRPIMYSLILYLILGWAGIPLTKPALRNVSKKILGFIVLGGVSYTVGTYFFYHDKEVPFYHAIWHLFVFGGSLSHWVAVFFAIKEK